MSPRKLSSKIAETSCAIKLLACPLLAPAPGKMDGSCSYQNMMCFPVRPYLVVYISTTVGDYYQGLRVGTPVIDAR
jgi:hypothetical protein